MMIGYCTLDDYLQLQLLLQHEQRRRERIINHHLQHHKAIRHRNAQQYRLARALQNLKLLKESYRRARAYQVQRYMEYYRNQALVAAMEEAFFRPALALAIEQRRADAVKQLQEKSTGIEEDNVHAEQLSNLLRLLFDQQLNKQELEEEQSHAEVNDDDQEANDLWQYITNPQQSDQQPEKEEEEPHYDEIDKPLEGSPVTVSAREPVEQDDQEAMQESPILHMAQENAVPDQPVPQDSRIHDKEDYDVQDAVNKVLHRQTAQAKEPEAVNVIDNRAGVPEHPYMETINPHEHDYDEEDDPPLDSSVLDLQDLLKELVSDSSDSASSAAEEKPEDDSMLFAPKHVVTEAEPTPQQEDVPVPQQDDEDEDFVHKIAEQQKQNLPTADPEKYERLQEIDRELRDIQANRQAKVLSTPLYFQNKAGSLELTATTPQNREFLGCEDDIMKNILKLDMINSNGDEGIRGERKALVKKAESMLEQLDEHKQSEWERVRMPKVHARRRKRNSQRPHRHHHHHNEASGLLVG